MLKRKKSVEGFFFLFVCRDFLKTSFT